MNLGPAVAPESREAVRDRVIDAAIELVAAGGRDAVSTRAVCLAAGIQAPTIYRIFGDMRGLLDAVAARSFAAYLQEEAVRPTSDDPLEDLRAGWDTHVGFGLAHPGMYILMYGEPSPGVTSTAAQDAFRVLATLVGRVAAAGRLRVEEARASTLLAMAGSGATLTLLGTPPERRDLSMSHLARETVLAAITTDEPAVEDPGVVSAGLALRAHLHETTRLSAAEQGLMREWINRIVS